MGLRVYIRFKYRDNAKKLETTIGSRIQKE